MYARREFLIALLVLAALSTATPAQEVELKLGQVRESDLSPGQTQSFVISLADGDFAQIAVNPREQALIVKTYDPSGKPFRGAQLGPAADSLNLVAQAPGAYRVEVAGKDRQESGPYTIALQKVVTLAARLAPLKPDTPLAISFRARGASRVISSYWCRRAALSVTTTATTMTGR